MNDSYQTFFGRSNPGLIIFLIDGTENTAKAVNRVINTIIQKKFDGKQPINNCFITVIGCNSETKILISGYLQKFEANPLRIDEVTKKASDGAGGLVLIKAKMPIWIEPIDKGRWINTTRAFHLAKEIVEAWIADKPESPAPIIVNITDRGPNYDEKEISGTINMVNAIKNLDTNDGKVQIINAILEDNKKRVFFNSHTELASDVAKFLYGISTIIPNEYCKRMNYIFDLTVEFSSKCFVYSTDTSFIEILIEARMIDGDIKLPDYGE